MQYPGPTLRPSGSELACSQPPPHAHHPKTKAWDGSVCNNWNTKSFPASSKVKTLFKVPGLTKISTELTNVQIWDKIMSLTLWASQQYVQNQAVQRQAGLLFDSCGSAGWDLSLEVQDKWILFLIYFIIPSSTHWILLIWQVFPGHPCPTQRTFTGNWCS